MLVAIDRHRLALLLRHVNGDDLLRERAVGLRTSGALLAAQREAVLRIARDAEVHCDVFSRLGHRIDAVLLAHRLVDEAPADGRIEDLGRRAKASRPCP